MTSAHPSSRPPASPVRVRIAPSPTGYMHVGTARTALFNWLFAHQQGGTFILRVEDTDRARFVPGALDDLLDGLRWLGLHPDEGPGAGGDYGPYLQSERLNIYRPYADMLVSHGHAYRCFCSAERLRAVREARQQAGRKLGYDRHCRGLAPAEAERRVAAGEPHVIRLSVPLEGVVTLRDLLRGEITFDYAEIEDVILIKTDGYPTYHFAVVVDDHAMAITHVLRADEWIPSAPVQVRLYQAFGWTEPVWAHVPLVLDPAGGKLSKRHGGAEVRGYRAAGYLPEAMFNFLARLGWAYSADEEIFSRQQALERFRIEDIKPVPATWDIEKLNWMNGAYIRALAPGDLAARLLPFLRQAGLPVTLEDARRIVPLVQERIITLADAAPLIDFIWAASVDPAIDELIPKDLDGRAVAELLAAAESALRDVAPWAHDAIEAALRGMALAHGLKPGTAFQPIRLATTGRKVAPPLFDTLAVLGRETTLARLAAARGRLVADGVPA